MLRKAWIFVILLLAMPVALAQLEASNLTDEEIDALLEKEELGRPKYPHRDYDWWEFEEVPLEEFASCPACHESLGGKAGRKTCEDCHLPYRSGPYKEYPPAGLILTKNFSAPLVYYHVQEFADPNAEIEYRFEGDPIWVRGQSAEFGGNTFSSCFGYNPKTGEGTCHGITLQKPVDGHFALNASKPVRDSPFQYAVPKESLSDSTKCLYCHSQTDPAIIRAWGDPRQLGLHFNATKDEDCFQCHVVGKTKPSSFHVMGPIPERVNKSRIPGNTSTGGKGLSSGVPISVFLVVSLGLGVYVLYRKRLGAKSGGPSGPSKPES